MKIKDRFKNSNLWSGIVTDYGYRTVVFFICSFTVNLLIAGFHAATGILYKSIWYGALAIYYIALALQKGALLLSLYGVKKKHTDDNESYRRAVAKIYTVNGVILLLLQAALTVAIVQMVSTENPADTGMIIAIASAAYAFYKISIAIFNYVKTTRMQNLVLQTLRNVNLVDASVSILALTSTLICTFGEFENMRTTLVFTAIGVSLVIIGIGVSMIAKGIFKLKEKP